MLIVKPTVHFLLALAVVVVMLFLFLGLTYAGFGGILFIIGWGYTRSHNLYFYLTLVVCFAAFYLCARAGYGWIGAIGVVFLFHLSKVLRMYENAHGQMNWRGLKQKNSRPNSHSMMQTAPNSALLNCRNIQIALIDTDAGTAPRENLSV